MCGGQAWLKTWSAECEDAHSAKRRIPSTTTPVGVASGAMDPAPHRLCRPIPGSHVSLVVMGKQVVEGGTYGNNVNISNNQQVVSDICCPWPSREDRN